jgi:hypothetical protein
MTTPTPEPRRERLRTAWHAVRGRWAAVLATPRGRIEVGASLLATAAVLLAEGSFLPYIEARPGAVLFDPVLALLPPVALDWLIFPLTYGPLLAWLTVAALQPQRLAAGLQSYIGMVLFRIAALYLTPLEAPLGVIPLRDPVVELSTGGQVVVKDLFFSGHLGTASVVAFNLPPGPLRRLVWLDAAVLAGALLVHRAHYTVDVLAAPVFAYCATRIAHALHRKLSGGSAR